MKRFLFLGLALVLISARGIAAAATPVESGRPSLRTAQLLESGQPVRIVCFGDSITGIYYHTGGRRAWSDLVGLALRQLYPHAQLEVINAGVSGNSTVDALKRIEIDVLSRRPQLVMVMLGMNDTARVPEEEFRANLTQIVQRVEQVGSEVILMTPNPVSPGDTARPVSKVAAYAQIVREVGRSLNVPVSDMYRAFQSVQSVDPRAWLGAMSDAIHPNMRGHRIFAEEVVWTLTGQRVSLGELPRLQPGLPRLWSRLQAKELVRVVAMKPFDTLIVPALHRLYPDAQIEVTAWDATGKSIEEIEGQAKSLGWPKYHDQPTLPQPDLFVLAVPAEALAADEAQFFHSYMWIMNWSQSFRPPGWGCLVVLPSVAQPDQDQAQRAAEHLAREVILGQDLPWLERTPGDTRPAAELLDQKLAELLEAPKS